MSLTIQLTYIFDPLCGWCYGASPSVEKLMHQEDIAVTALPSGLFSGSGAFPMNASFAAHAWEADQRIGQLTGQAFTEEYRRNVLESGAGSVDSGPATLALSAVHLTAPEREFEALKAIQGARYVDGRNNGDAEVIASVLTELGLDAAAARFAEPNEELLTFNKKRIDAAQAEMRRFGARGVPTLVLGEGSEARVIPSNGLYSQADDLIASLRAA
ncbi:DsbA family protein (plasmid) [Mameliella alba]|uniref:DsbA family protein n=1 Tax=Mameliella alba TaxID=561184 RepID=UPI0013E42F6E|nr:DsbA family protein [Mameliella alba]BBU59517.1 DsbA family protein [Mameliella alba]